MSKGAVQAAGKIHQAQATDAADPALIFFTTRPVSSSCIVPPSLYTVLGFEELQQVANSYQGLVIYNSPLVSAAIRSLLSSEYALYPIIVEQPPQTPPAHRTAVFALRRFEDISAWFAGRIAAVGQRAALLEANHLLEKAVPRQSYRTRKWTRICPPPENPVMQIYLKKRKRNPVTSPGLEQLAAFSVILTPQKTTQQKRKRGTS